MIKVSRNNKKSKQIKGAMTKLICPFCGCSPIIEKIDNTWDSECFQCGIVAKGFESENDCITWWNRRADSEPLSGKQLNEHQ